MKKSELLRALQIEIQKHNLSTYMSKEHKIVQTGCFDLSKTFRNNRAVHAAPDRRRASAAVG
jgi:hypothetical protein